MKKKLFRVSLKTKIKSYINRGKTVNVKFVHEDGSKVTQHLSDKFIEGKPIDRIMDDLHAIKHDMNAKYITV